MNLSIVINTYRRPQALVRCLESIAAHWADAVGEVIVVDDGGGLDFAPIRSRFDGQLPLKFISIGLEGRGAARNRGIQSAGGRRILFLGDDVMVESGCIQRHLAQSDPMVAVVGPYPWKGLRGSPPFRHWAEPNPQERIANPDHAGFQFFATGNLSVDRQTLLNLGGFDERFYRYGWEDIDLGLRFERAGGRLVFDPLARAIHDHPGMTRAALWRREMEMGFTAWQFWEKWAIELGAPEAVEFMKFWVDPARIAPGPRWRRILGHWLLGLLDRLAPDSRLNWRLYKRMIFAQRLAGVAEAWRISGSRSERRQVRDMGATNRQIQAAQAMPAPLRRGGAGANPRCTVGLLTWNAGDDAETCAASLSAQTESSLDLIWIDNASTDDTVARLRARFPVLPAPTLNPRNLGFCAGHNQALAACASRYYLALNQDVALAPDYIRRLCDWMDSHPRLALTSGLILMGESQSSPRVWSAGLVFPRNRFPFSLGMGGPVRDRWRRRRLTPGVDGCAMMLRVEACRAVSLPSEDVFPQSFFAYCEEVDLALRLARAGWRCGVEGGALAWHRARGSGGFAKAGIRARFFANHWLTTLRNESWGAIARDLPWIVRGEAAHWLPEYLQHPGAFFMALGIAAREAGAARAFYHTFEHAHGPTRRALERLKRFALAELRRSPSDIE